MLIHRIADNEVFSSLKEMQRLREQLNRALSVGTAAASEYPPINVWTSEHGAIVQTEMPGIDISDVEISLVNDTLTIKGSRNQDSLKDGEICYRQERGHGQFTRSLQLPFGLAADNVEARFSNGVLQIKLPRVEEEKPRKIGVVCQ
jgi:HSP20 family protein